MENEILNNIIVIRINQTSRNMVLDELSSQAIKAGYAKEGFDEALIKRENNYPTGLHLEKMDIAIPHADAEWTVKSSLTIGILDSPVEFRPMGEIGDPILAEIVFLLTIKNPKEHIDFLRVFTSLMSESDLLKDLKKTGDPKKILELLQSGLPKRKS